MKSHRILLNVLTEKEATTKSLSGGDMKKLSAVSLVALVAVGVLTIQGTRTIVAQTQARELLPAGNEF